MNDVAEKHLAAVMFTDIVGYTALMQESEELARRARDRHRGSLEPSVTRNEGTVLQYFGDGSLSVFVSPAKAVLAALDMQKQLRDDPPVPLRIGIHFGEVSYDAQGAYGDSVNVAARIESLSASGGILISERVVDQLESGSPLQTMFVGEFPLKNVREAVRVHAVVGEGLRVPTADEVRRRLSGGQGEADKTFAPDSGFEIVRLLGEGLLGRVYLARETRLGRTVIVKMMRPDLFADPDARRRFEREARSVARLSHPNLATLLRVGEAEDGIPFLVMEYVKGVSLVTAIEADGPLSESTGLRILIQVASALASAHEAGIVHRNVKPANVIWDADAQRAVLTDFGFARILDEDQGQTHLTQLTTVSTEMSVMSPERLMGEALTTASDVYSLALLGYQVLADAFPHTAETASELARAQLMDPPTPLRDLNPGVSPAFAATVERCLVKDPALRPSAREVVRALSELDGASHPAKSAEAPTEGSSDHAGAQSHTPPKGGGLRALLDRILGR